MYAGLTDGPENIVTPPAATALSVLPSLTTLFLVRDAYHVLPTLFSKITGSQEPVVLHLFSRHAEGSPLRGSRRLLVEAIGFEPTTPWLQTRCSTS